MHRSWIMPFFAQDIAEQKGWHIPLTQEPLEISWASRHIDVYGHAMEVSPPDILVWICIQRGSLLFHACGACLWRTPQACFVLKLQHALQAVA